jgi:hypothetical protein
VGVANLILGFSIYRARTQNILSSLLLVWLYLPQLLSFLSFVRPKFLFPLIFYDMMCETFIHNQILFTYITLVLFYQQLYICCKMFHYALFLNRCSLM